MGRGGHGEGRRGKRRQRMELLRILAQNRYIGPLLVALGVAVVMLVFNIDTLLGEPENNIGPKSLATVAVTVTVILGMLFHDTRRKYARLNEQTERQAELADRLSVAIEALNNANAELRESEERYRGLVETQDAVIIRRTAEGPLSFVNDTFCEMFGLSREAAVGSDYAPEIHPEDQGIADGLRPNLELPPYRIRYDQRVLSRQGWRWIAWVDYAIRDDRGVVREVQSIGRDVTDRKLAEQQLQVARDEAEAANRAKSSFLATVSHEIRTPMNGVLGMARLLLETDLSAQQRGYAKAVRESGEALLSIINDILDYSKIEAGKLTLEEAGFDLFDTVEQACELLAARAVEKDIAIGACFAPEVPVRLFGDAGRLRQVLLNLGGNAIKFTDRGGVMISVTATFQGAANIGLLFEVKDTGIGIPVELQDRLFHEFSQVDSGSTRCFGGTGLGLVISQRIVERMKGEIGVESNAEQGSNFWFTVDLARDSREGPEVADDIDLTGQRVLVCLGNPIAREIVRRMLIALGAAATVAGGEADAYVCLERAAASGERFDTALIDGSLPDGGAGRLGEAIRDGATAAATPCRLTVLLRVDQDRQLGDLADRGYQGYLVMPIRRRALIRSMKGAFDAVSAADQAPMGAGHTDPLPPTDSGQVLLVEDNRINQMLAQALLRKLGLETACVENGREAVRAVAGGEFDLVLMDVNMPVMDGLQATREIRKLDGRPGRVPVVAMTAGAMDEDRQRCLAAGMNDYISKPVEDEELQRVIAEWTDLAMPAPARSGGTAT